METREIIKQLRTEANMSQDELAKKAGYTDRSSIAKIEAGRVDLTESKLKAIANALDTTVAVLLGLVVPIESKKTPTVVEDERLTEDEAELLGTYRTLNDYGKERALETLRDLAALPKYQQGDNSVQAV